MTSSKRGRGRPYRSPALTVLAGVITFVVAIVGSALLHLRTPTARRVVAFQVNELLAKTLVGKIHIERVGAITPGGVDGVSVRITDPEGVQVIRADDVSAEFRSFAFVRSLLGKGPIAISITSASLSSADVNLDADAKGELRIANTFVPRKASKKPEEPPGPGVRVEIADIRLGHVWVHGKPPGALPLDADLFDGAGELAVVADNVRIDLTRAQLLSRGMPRALNPEGRVVGHLALPAKAGHGMELRVSFDGHIGEMPTSAEGALVDRKLDARLDTHLDPGEGGHSLANGIVVREALSLHAEAHGEFPHIEAEAKLIQGEANVDLGAVVDAGLTTRIGGTIAARHVDLSAFVVNAPVSDIGLDGSGDIELSGGGAHGAASVTTLPGRIAADDLPRVKVNAKLDGENANAQVTIADPRMPSEVTLDLSPRADGRVGQEVDAVVHARVADLRNVPKLGAVTGGGSAKLDAEAHLTLPERLFDAKASVVIEKLKEKAFGARVVHAEVHARGTLEHPVLDADVRARDLSTPTVPFDTVNVAGHVERTGKTLTVERARLEASRKGRQITATVARIRIAGSALQVEDAEVRGLGEPVRAAFTKELHEFRGTIDAPRVDLALVAELAKRGDDVRRGTLSLAGEGRLLPDGDVKGATVHLEIRDLQSTWVNHTNAVVDASADGRDIGLDAHVSLGRDGRIDLQSRDVVIDGKATEPKAWKRIRGKVSLDGNVDLAKITALLPALALPPLDLSGSVSIQGHAKRDNEDAAPEIGLHAYTRDLVVADRAPESETAFGGVQLEQASRWRSAGVDLGIDFQNDGSSGLTMFALRATDASGPLLALDAKAIVPYDELLADPANAQSVIFAAPFSAKAIFGQHSLDRLPPSFGVKDIAGSVEGELDGSGTVLDPRVHFVGHGRGVRTATMRRDAKADTDVVLDYDGTRADLAVQVNAKGKQMLDLKANLEGRARDVILGTDGPLAWKASGHVRMTAFPLEAVPALGDKRMKGSVNADISLERLHENAHVQGRVDIDGLKVGKAVYDRGTITLDASNGGLAAQARFDQSDGFVEVNAKTGLRWGAAVVPSLDPTSSIEGRLQAKAFRAAALGPFLGDVTSQLDGRIDADASIQVAPGQTASAMKGTVTLRDGSARIPFIGETFRNARARVTLSPDGTIKVEDFFADGSSGELRAEGAVKLDGLRMTEANGKLMIPNDKPLDLAINGDPLGDVSGTIKAGARQSPDGSVTAIVVEVPELAVALGSLRTQGVQSLERPSNIHVGVYRPGKRFVKLPLDRLDAEGPRGPKVRASRIEVEIRLGQVDVKKGNQAKVTLTGNTKVNIDTGGEGPTLTGQIRTMSGWADVQGKKFDVEKGTLTFQGESPPNPVVALTAAWTSGDGVRVYADFIGPLRSGKLVLRSEPPRPQNELLALVLFGTADGMNRTPPPPGSQQSGASNAAVGIGGGLAAQGLTEALDDLTGIEATARIDTTSSTNPRPGVQVQVSRKVTVGYAYVIGTPPVTEPDKNLATANYRFHKNWSLETTVGDRGRVLLEAVWRRRY